MISLSDQDSLVIAKNTFPISITSGFGLPIVLLFLSLSLSSVPVIPSCKRIRGTEKNFALDKYSLSLSQEV